MTYLISADLRRYRRRPLKPALTAPEIVQSQAAAKRFAQIVVVASLLLGAGCRNVDPSRLQTAWATEGLPNTPALAARDEETVARFSQRRDEATFAAAQAHWHNGDWDECRTLLTRLLDRTPDHREATLLLADLAVAEGDIQSAETILRAWLARVPDDGEANHALGLLLETVDRPQEALVFLDRASASRPRNSLYRESHNMLARTMMGSDLNRAAARPGEYDNRLASRTVPLPMPAGSLAIKPTAGISRVPPTSSPGPPASFFRQVPPSDRAAGVY